MKPAVKKPNRHSEWYSKAGAYENAVQLQMWPLWFLPILLIQPGFSGAWPLLFPLILLPIFLGPRRQGILGIYKLRDAIAWFDAEPVTVHPLPEQNELEALLKKHGYDTIELDGSSIRSWHDLAVVLQDKTVRMEWPANDRQKVRAILTYLATEKPRQHVLIWRNASVAAQSNPALVPAMAADWSAHAPQLPPGLLVFIDLEDADAPAPTSPEQVLHRSGDGSQPDRSILKDAPEGAWWTPNPGELTR